MSTTEARQGTQKAQSYDHPQSSSKPTKRARVAVACTRCKSRKQKCDGGQPTCGNCKNLTIKCEYIVPSRTISHGKYQYIKALEARVAELEALLNTHGSSTIDPDGPSSDATPSISGGSQSPATHKAEDPKLTEATRFLKDLSLHAGGGYVGDESSNITVGQIFGAVMQVDAVEAPTEHKTIHRESSVEQYSPDSQVNLINPLAEIPFEIAEILYKGYLKHISTRWPVLYRPYITHLHKKNFEKTLTDPVEVSTLNLIYAIAGRFLETVGEGGTFQAQRHYQAATEHLNIIIQPHDVASIQTLLLHAIYCLRAPKGLSAWTNVGLAIRICMSLGLHRKAASVEKCLANEIKKRVFWSCYCLDRQVSIILGRPFAISDRDIDVEFPMDISDSMSDAAIQAIPDQDYNRRAEPSTSLSNFVHVIRLRKIESQIQTSIYRVDKHKPLVRAKIDHFIAVLDNWRCESPAPFSEHDTEVYSYDGSWYFDVYYYKCLRLLLFPHLSAPFVDPEIILRCADACGGVCRSYKALHRETIVGFSLMAIYTIFLSGLTLLYCLWISPTTVYSASTTNDLNACSIVLYVIAERWPTAKRYRDAFETIKQNVLALVEQGSSVTRCMPVPGLRDASLRDLGSHGFHNEEAREYSKMMNDMVQPPEFQQAYEPMPPPPPPLSHNTPKPRAMSDQTNFRSPVLSTQLADAYRSTHSVPHAHYPMQQQNFQMSTYDGPNIFANNPNIDISASTTTMPQTYAFPATTGNPASNSVNYAPESVIPSSEVGDSLMVQYDLGNYMGAENNFSNC